MECRDVEESLSEAAKVFQLVHELIQARRACVYRGLAEPNAQLDQEEKQLYTDWLALIDGDMARLEALESTYGTIEGANEIRACRDSARAFLERWTPAVPARAVGSRVIDFSEEDADQIRAALNGPPGTPGQSTRPARSLPTGDPSLLK
jgi:hypothetical protein